MVYYLHSILLSSKNYFKVYSCQGHEFTFHNKAFKYNKNMPVCLGGGGGWTYIPYNKQIFYNTVENANNYNWRIFN